MRVAGRATPPEVPLIALITSGIPSSLNSSEVSDDIGCLLNGWIGFL